MVVGGLPSQERDRRRRGVHSRCGCVGRSRTQQRLAAEQRRFDDDQTQEVGVAGDKHAVADAVHRWTVAGADSVVLQPTGDDPDPAGFGRWIVDEVCPLIR